MSDLLEVNPSTTSLEHVTSRLSGNTLAQPQSNDEADGAGKTKTHGSALGRVHTHDLVRATTEKAGKKELKSSECYDELAYSFSRRKKWYLLCTIFAIQCSMNFNAGAYGSAVPQLEEQFGISTQTARLGQGLFLICYAFGCELWAPFSEEFGRWPVMQMSLFFVNIWALACALSTNFTSIVIFRVLGGFSSAGGSVTLAYVADMYTSDVQGHPVAFVVLSSVGGSILGPIIGAFQARYLSWHWNFWLQLIFGVSVQFAHFWTSETKESVLVTRAARRRRAAGEGEVYSADELRGREWSAKEVALTMSRPFVMFATEPIVLCLSLLSGFSDALIFTFLEAYGPVYSQWNFGIIAQGLAFLAIGVGYLLAYFSFFPHINKLERALAKDPSTVQPERRLYWLLYTCPLLSIGLFGFAWTSTGPPIPWIVSLIFTAFIGIANYSIYNSTIDYMINSYGPYSASATGGNGFARDFLAGIAAFYAAPLYSNLSKTEPLAWASTLLGCLAVLVTIPIYVFYWYGPQIRARSKFAMQLSADKTEASDKALDLTATESKPVIAKIEA